MPFPPRLLDELRARVSLAEVIGKRVKLTRRGREFIGLCPFHNEKSPSFTVNEEKGFFHCFGCGANGDVIGFVMQRGAGVPRGGRGAGAARPGSSCRSRRPRRATAPSAHRRLHDAVAAAADYFVSQLPGDPAAREARDYLQRRGLDEATIRRFRLGYAPDRRDGLKRALAATCAEPLLIEAGLVRRPEDGGADLRLFPRPGHVPDPRPLGPGYRLWRPGDGRCQAEISELAGYADLPQGQRALRPGPGARGRGKGASAIVTEGYMDVIALHRAGFGTAVAPLGTALTEQQLEEVWKLAPEPVLCFDGDAAGQRAAGRALDRALPMLKAGRSLRFAVLPDGDDPDTLVQRQVRRRRDARRARRGRGRWPRCCGRSRPRGRPTRRSAGPPSKAASTARVGQHRRPQPSRNITASFFRERVYAISAAPSVRRGGRGRGAPRRGSPAAARSAPRRQSIPACCCAGGRRSLVAPLLNHPFLVERADRRRDRRPRPAGAILTGCGGKS